MEEINEFTTGLQCCIRCGRLMIDRGQHDRLEDSVLASIEAEHPEWVTNGECAPCVTRYREILSDRLKRDEIQQERAARNTGAFHWLAQYAFGRSVAN